MIQLFVKTERQKIWLQRIRERAAQFQDQSAEIDELAKFPEDHIATLIGMGYTRTTLPEKYGGEGLGVYDMILLQETLATFDENTALSIGWNQSVIGDIFEQQLWTEENLQFFANEIAGGAIVNRSVSEAQTGSPARGGRPGTNAVRQQDGSWLINGRKTFTTASPALTYFLTSVWIEEKQQIGYFLLHKDTVGLSIDETWDVISMRATGSHDLVLDQVNVKDALLVELPKKPSGKYSGWQLHTSACYLGIAQAARDYAVQFANRHAPNSINGPISQLPNVQQHIGEMDLQLIQARHLLYSVAEAYDDKTRRDFLTHEVEAAKHTVTNAAIAIVDQAMRVVGAKSLQRSNPLQRYYRNVRAGLHNPPMDDMTIQRLAKAAIEEEKNRNTVPS